MPENGGEFSSVSESLRSHIPISVGTPRRIFEGFPLQTKTIPQFLQPFTEEANWITSSKAGTQGFQSLALGPRFRGDDEFARPQDFLTASFAAMTRLLMPHRI
jgi:hypothetical protein